MSLMPEDWPSVGRFAGDLGVGAGAGVLGVIARELARSDRELSWKLIPQMVSGAAIGTLGWMGAGLLGLDNPEARFVAAFCVGMAGQAAVMDAITYLARKRGLLPPK